MERKDVKNKIMEILEKREDIEEGINSFWQGIKSSEFENLAEEITTFIREEMDQ